MGVKFSLLLMRMIRNIVIDFQKRVHFLNVVEILFLDFLSQHGLLRLLSEMIIKIKVVLLSKRRRIIS